MSAMQVLVYDDHPEIAESLANRVRTVCGEASVTAVKQDDFQESIGLLNSRRTAWRRGESKAALIESNLIDTADVIVIDYDLLGYSDQGDTTGSRLAYLLRCFSKCGLIVVLNEYGANSFDLSLRSPSAGFADLHLGDIQIGNPGLWTRPFEGYRPWHWPSLPEARSDFEECVKDVEGNLEEPILEFLGLQRLIDWLPKGARDFFHGSGNLESVRFNDFVKRARGGAESKDELPPEYMARVAAARLLALLNSLILPEQSILVDAPHLASRFPSLVREEHRDIHGWNGLCDPISENVDELLADVVQKHRFEKRHWLWRPAWYWPDISRDARIPEVQDPWVVEDVDWVFCENVSRFVPGKLADDFRADVSPPFDKRFVLRREAQEALELVGKIGTGGAQDPLVVEYVPQAAFSM
ncbi:MAG: hypothetical protein OXH19_05590 [Chloroflexi bacterium]|nr:hypothetical protein [Chloroflexota bacterium]MCY3589952.1 hypothetical protein [Chloroflexota bacterium]MCY3684607.1 hypothetical protein [Chloroflexota bacterium]MDE2709997.1 hypothetical protein [Chloroflexota bacterium]